MPNCSVALGEQGRANCDIIVNNCYFIRQRRIVQNSSRFASVHTRLTIILLLLLLYMTIVYKKY